MIFKKKDFGLSKKIPPNATAKFMPLRTLQLLLRASAFPAADLSHFRKPIG